MKWEKEKFKEKRFWLFLWNDYQAQGGLDDIHSSHDTLDAAKIDALNFSEVDNISIYDSQEQMYYFVRKSKPVINFRT